MDMNFALNHRTKPADRPGVGSIEDMVGPPFERGEHRERPATGTWCRGRTEDAAIPEPIAHHRPIKIEEPSANEFSRGAVRNCLAILNHLDPPNLGPQMQGSRRTLTRSGAE